MTVIAIVLFAALGGAVVSIIRPIRPYKSREQAAVAALIVIGLLYWMYAPALRARDAAHVRASTPTASTSPSKPAAPSAIWQAKVDTLACSTQRSVETLQFLDALGKSQGVRNPASDPSKTDCVSVSRGTKLGVHKFGGEVVAVDLPGHGQLYMLSDDIAVGR